MAGHNKWSKIKHKKASTDATKSRIFSQLSNLIRIEVKQAGGDRNAPSVKNSNRKGKKRKYAERQYRKSNTERYGKRI